MEVQIRTANPRQEEKTEAKVRHTRHGNGRGTVGEAEEGDLTKRCSDARQSAEEELTPVRAATGIAMATEVTTNKGDGKDQAMSTA